MSSKHAVVRARGANMLQHASTCFNMLQDAVPMQHELQAVPMQYPPPPCVYATYMSACSYMCASHASRRMLKLRVYERRGEGMRIWVREACCGLYMGARGLYMGARGLLRLVYACGLFRRSHAACILMRRGWWRWGLEGRGWARG